MTTLSVPHKPSPDLPWPALAGLAAILVAELAAIGTIFIHQISFECGDNWSEAACTTASLTLVGVYCVIAAVALTVMLRPAPFRELLAEARVKSWALLLNFAGLVLTLIPLTFLVEGQAANMVLPSFALWVSGMGLILLGLALCAGSPAAWSHLVLQNKGVLIPALLLGFSAPWLAVQIQPTWRFEEIATMTFVAVTWIVTALGYAVEADIPTRVIGNTDFAIGVGPSCSGVEGIALITLFISLYIWLFRGELRFPRALLLYPIGLVASAAFNVFRIALLLVIGLEGNPVLAVGGFHSHAGWLMFTLVALGIIALAQNLTWMKRAPVPAPAAAMLSSAASGQFVPFWRDPMVARILPFAVFMLTALAISAFFTAPSTAYPLRVLAMAAVMLPFLWFYRALCWRIDLLAVGLGAAIGIYWVLIPVAPQEMPPYGALTGGLLAVWMIARGIGTTFLVPVIEELFFRDYLEGLFRRAPGKIWSVGAALTSATLFAVLHGRWAEAFVAGLIFSWLAVRPGGRITDAIIAHMIANGLIFTVALYTMRFEII